MKGKRHQIKETLKFFVQPQPQDRGPFFISLCFQSSYREKEVLPDSLAECLWESVAFRARIHRVQILFSHFFGENGLTTGPQGPDLRLNVVGWITLIGLRRHKQKEKWKNKMKLSNTQSHLGTGTLALFSRRQQWLGSSEELPQFLMEHQEIALF